MPVRSAVLVVSALVLAACGSTAPVPGDPPSTIRLASYDFPEHQILTEVYAEALRRAELPVSVQHGIGTREVVAPALQQGVVDVVVEYLGTALAFVEPGSDRLPEEPADMHAALARVLDGRDIAVLRPARAQDQNGFAVTTAFVRREGVRRLSELRPLASELVFGGPAECPERPYCLRGLRAVYGLEFARVETMPSRAATVEALLAGEIDVGLLETTSARLVGAPVLLLEDDRSLQPAENVVPLVREEVLARWGPEVRAALDDVSARLTTQDLVRLNRWVELEGAAPAEAALRWWDGG